MEVIPTKCPKCEKKDFRYRLKTQDYICNKCGYPWKLKEEEDIDG